MDIGKLKIYVKSCKQNIKSMKAKLKEFLKKARNFNLTLYLLKRNELLIIRGIEDSEEMIEFYQDRIRNMKSNIEKLGEWIIREKDHVKELKANGRKIQKVIKLKNGT